MPAGLQVYNPNGSLRIDMTMNYCKMMGSFWVGGNGSRWVSEFSLGRPFFIVIPDSSKGTHGKTPTVRVDGNTLIYEYAYAPNMGFYNVGVWIHYGYY